MSPAQMFTNIKNNAKMVWDYGREPVCSGLSVLVNSNPLFPFQFYSSPYIHVGHVHHTENKKLVIVVLSHWAKLGTVSQATNYQPSLTNQNNY